MEAWGLSLVYGIAGSGRRFGLVGVPCQRSDETVSSSLMRSGNLMEGRRQMNDYRMLASAFTVLAALVGTLDAADSDRVKPLVQIGRAHV